jgi:serine protease Do
MAGMLVAGILVAVVATAPRADSGRVTPHMEAPKEARNLSRAFADVARAIGPSVVRIEVSTAREEGTASGIVIDTRGNIVTSNHVLDGKAPLRIDIVFVDGRRLPADPVGRDAASDVAVVRLRTVPRDLVAARFGDSDMSEIGEWVLAVGSPLGLEQTITAGIISGRAPVAGTDGGGTRSYLQTDAKVNPGNSGGPLVNLDGEVVGLAALISAGPGGSYGYAVPINRVRRTAQALIKHGRAPHPYIGVSLRDVRELDPTERRKWGGGAFELPPRGALVSRIWNGAPAARAGLRLGDVITSINNRDVPTPAELAELISAQEVGAKLVVGFVRSGTPRALPLSVAELPLGTISAAN